MSVHTLWKAYKDQTPDRLKFIDAFLAFILLSGVAQFLYLILVTDFPFNAFLAGYAIYLPLFRGFSQKLLIPPGSQAQWDNLC